MFSNLPEELVLEIFQFLDFADLGRVYTTCKGINKIPIYYNTYMRETIYTDENEMVSKSYLFTNGPKELPGQIKNNYLEIKLSRGVIMYHFIFYNNVYRDELDILMYLQNIDWKKTKKTISNLFSKSVKIVPDFPQK